MRRVLMEAAPAVSSKAAWFSALQKARRYCIMWLSNIRRRWAREGACVVGLLDDVFGNELDNMLNQYPACVEELKEGAVQAIFNRCLRKEGSKEIIRTTLFSRVLGYDEKDEIEIAFDKNVLLENEKNVRYLYGQLKVVHTAESKTNCLSLKSFKDKQLVLLSAVGFTFI